MELSLFKWYSVAV